MKRSHDKQLSKIGATTVAYVPQIVAPPKDQLATMQQSPLSKAVRNMVIERPVERPIQRPTDMDNLELFFAGIADTMRTFSKHEIAKIKLEISKMVGEAEVKLSSPSPTEMSTIYYSKTTGIISDQTTNQEIGNESVLIITNSDDDGMSGK